MRTRLWGRAHSFFAHDTFTQLFKENDKPAWDEVKKIYRERLGFWDSIDISDDEEKELNGKIERLLIDLDPFIRYEDMKKKFATYVVGENVKDTNITAYVNQIWEKGAFQDNMKKTDLWKVLHDAGVYKAGISNWNDQVEKPRHRK